MNEVTALRDGDLVTAILISFQDKSDRLVMDINSGTDEIKISIQSTFAGQLRQEEPLPWLTRSMAGHGMRWFWTLTNSEGYEDAVQIEIGPKVGGNGGKRTFQFLAMASQIRVRQLSLHGMV